MLYSGKYIDNLNIYLYLYVMEFKAAYTEDLIKHCKEFKWKFEVVSIPVDGWYFIQYVNFESKFSLN